MTGEKIIIHIDDEDVLELAPGYLAKRRNELPALRNALTLRDFEILVSIGHQMKGSGGGFGFDRITEIGGNLEASAKTQDTAAIGQEIAALQNYLDCVEITG
jgi:HPt (histidine-containing phosphotransfer) domain-containing protein